MRTSQYWCVLCVFMYITPTYPILFFCPFTASVPEYNLTGEFCRKHFLTGLLLRELGLALQDEQDLRHLALSTLKTLMAKHSLDARYATKVTETHPYGRKKAQPVTESWAPSRNSSHVTHTQKTQTCDSFAAAVSSKDGIVMISGKI